MRHTLALFGSLLGLGLALFLGTGCNSASNSESSSATTPVSYAQAAVTGAAISSAMQKASSWHMTMKGPNVEMSMDVVCPDKMRTLSKTAKMTAESVRVGADMYVKAGSRWMKTPATGQPASVCGNAGNGYAGGAGSKVPTFDPTVKMTKGGSETVNGESCTDWTTTVSDNKGSQRSYVMCLGSDNLPRQIKTGDMVMTYSDWNKPITIEAPQL